MDPEVTLEILRATVAEFRKIADSTGPEQPSNIYDLVDLGETMTEAFESLDQWMVKGGFTPKSWQPNRNLWKST